MAQSALRQLVQAQDRLMQSRSGLGLSDAALIQGQAVPESSRLQRFTSLDSPQDMSLGETAADIVMGFTPGIGTAQGLRDFERARRDDDALGMLLGGLGVVGAGGIVKAGRAAGQAAGYIPEAISGQRIVQPKPGDFPAGFENRVGELRKIYDTPMRYVGAGVEPPPISIYDLEGRQFVTSMADRSDAGTSLIGIGDVDFDIPVDLRGGQGYMFNNPGELWAAAKGPSGLIQSTADMAFNAAALAGRTDAPLYIPYRMGAPGGDFSHHTTDTMLTYARSSMPQNMIRRANAEIATVMPEFLGIENPNSMRQLSSVSNRQRQEVRNILDKQFRDQGGIGIGQARLAISDPAQYNAMTGGIQNVGQFDVSRRIAPSSHPSYPYSIPGEGLGALVEQDISIYDLLPDLAIARGVDPSMPIPQSEMYTLQTGLKGIGQPHQIDPTGKARPFVGIITDKVLRNIERKRGQQ